MNFSRQRNALGWILVLAAGVIVLPTHFAYAYLDPGTGSFLLQILVAGFLGVVFALRLFRGRIASLFRRLLGREIDAGEAEDVVDE